MFDKFTPIGKSRVKLKVAGDIHQFRPIDVETFRQMLAQQCGKNIEYVCDAGIVQGSIILYFEVLSECKQHFLSSREELTKWCLNNNVIQVCFDDEEIIAVTLPPAEVTGPRKCKFQ